MPPAVQVPNAAVSRLVFPGRMFDDLREMLLLDKKNETAAFLLAKAVFTPSGDWRLLAKELLELSSDDYAVRTRDRIELPPSVVDRAIARARNTECAIILVHSHPAGRASPSEDDRAGERLLIPAFRRRVPNVPHARLIISPTEVHAAAFLPAEGNAPVEETTMGIVQIGSEVSHITADYAQVSRQHITKWKNEDASADQGVYDRQVRAFGQEGQRVLEQTRVLIVGLGGTGSIVAEQLAHLGVKRFVLIDPDFVDRSNLNRIAGAGNKDLDRAKVEVAAEMIRSINPDVSVHMIRGDVCLEKVARTALDSDVFFCCTDSHGSRWVLSQLAYQYFLPGFDIGVVIKVTSGRVTHVSGRVQMLAPGLPCLVCGNILDSELVRQDLLTQSQRAADPYVTGANIFQPAVMSINGVASSVAVTMFLSAFVGIPFRSRYAQLRLEAGVVSRVETKPLSECVVCSSRGVFGLGDAGGPIGRRVD